MDSSGAVKSQLEMARNVHDMSSINTLRSAAKGNDPEALKEAAHQFEAIFVQMLLKSMRKAQDAIADKDSPFNSQQVKFYRDMHDQQLATDLASSGSLGLADIIVRQLGNHSLINNAQTNTTSGDIASYNRQQRSQIFAASEVAIKPSSPEKQPAFASPEDFVTQLYPIAKQHALELGLEPKALIAQAAVETGWGQYMIHKADGQNANNLFGIKADQRWTGERAMVSTLEYKGDLPEKQKAQFRAYDSLQESVQDYVSFIKQNPRYMPAINQASDVNSYFKALQSSGYATDPKYADKVLSVLRSATLQEFTPNE
jgi:flagellar protein FlgJ